MFKIIWPWSKTSKEMQEFQEWKEKRSVENKNPEMIVMDPNGELSKDYLYDFLGWEASYGNYNRYSETIFAPGSPQLEALKMKITVKPIDVVNQLETAPTFFDLACIEEKIQLVLSKKELINNQYSKREVNGLLECLENRKKYTEFKEYFEGFQVTTDEKIGEVLDKHLLVRKAVEIFIPDFPVEAIKTMQTYTDKVMEVCGKKPIFYVIAEDDNFKKAYGKRDPILLAQSPFGFYWYILGAWDKEMLLLSEF